MDRGDIFLFSISKIYNNRLIIVAKKEHYIVFLKDLLFKDFRHTQLFKNYVKNKDEFIGQCTKISTSGWPIIEMWDNIENFEKRSYDEKLKILSEIDSINLKIASLWKSIKI